MTLTFIHCGTTGKIFIFNKLVSYRNSEENNTGPSYPSDLDSKESVCNESVWVQTLSLEDPLEKGMATHSSNLVWRIPWTEEPGGLQSMGLQRVGHN